MGIFFFSKANLKEDTRFMFGIENGVMTNVLMERWRLNEFILVFFSCVSIGISILEVFMKCFICWF